MNNDVLVIGAGITGIEAALLLAEAGRKVYLVEKTSMVGGNLVKYEEVFPNMECSTCMLAPKQQDLLQNANIELLTLASVESIDGSIGDYTAKIRAKAEYVSAVECIGCGACYEPCPVSIKNAFEENLTDRKAIFVPCPGALPNVPVIDTENCLRFTKGEECTLCQESCMFEAIDYTKEDRELELKVGAIIVSTGFEMFDPTSNPKFGDGKIDSVYTAMEFERLFASNGPTLGELTLRNGDTPNKIAIIYDVGKETIGYCPEICSMYPLKFSHYIGYKIENAEIINLYSDLNLPGKSYQAFYRDTLKPNVSFNRYEDIEVEANGNGASITYRINGHEEKIAADMVILAPTLVPGKGTAELAALLGIELTPSGFMLSKREALAPVTTSKEGIYLAGCVEGPKDIASSVEQASAAVGQVLSSLKEMA